MLVVPVRFTITYDDRRELIEEEISAATLFDLEVSVISAINMKLKTLQADDILARYSEKFTGFTRVFRITTSELHQQHTETYFIFRTETDDKYNYHRVSGPAYVAQGGHPPIIRWYLDGNEVRDFSCVLESRNKNDLYSNLESMDPDNMMTVLSHLLTSGFVENHELSENVQMLSSIL